MRTVARLACLGVLAALLSAAPSGAQVREFAGVVTARSGTRLTVENRMGDRRSFAGGTKTPVSGGRGSWGALQKGDRVIVSWSLEDKPAKAMRVRVRGKR